jgi:hypothetical protein
MSCTRASSGRLQPRKMGVVDNSHKQCTQGTAQYETRQQVAATAAEELYATVTGMEREVTDPVPVRDSIRNHS